MTDLSSHAWRVLLVDDDEDDFLITQSMLNQARGRSVKLEWVGSFSKGMEALRANNYDAVLVDYDLGGRNGVEMIRAAVQMGYAAPFILYTGRGNFEVDVEAMQAGATLNITKQGATPQLLERSIHFAIERKQTDRALRRSEQRWRQLAEAMPNMVWASDAEGASTYLSRQWLEYTGIPEAEQLDYGFSEQIHPEDRQASMDAWQSAVRSRTDIDINYRVRRFDGVYRWFKTRATPVFDENGRITQWYGSCTDIDDLVCAEAALQQHSADLEAARRQAETEKRRLEAVFDALPIGVAITDAQGGSVQANRAYEQIWAGPRPPVINVDDYTAYRAWWTESGEVVRSEEWASAQASLYGNKVIGQMLEIQRFDGSRASVLNSAAPIIGANGEVLGSAVAIQDISALRQAEAALRERETELRMIMDITPALISYIDRDFRYHRMNQNYARWFNRPMETMQGRTVQEVLGEATWELVRPRMERALQGETVSYEEKLPYSGGARYVHVNYIPHIDDSGQVRGFVVHVVDMEERKALEDALREAMERAVWLARFPGENPNPVARVSAEGVVLYCNPAANELPGWKLQIGAPLPEKLLPTVRQALLQAQMAIADVELLDEGVYSVTAMPFPDDGYLNLYGQDVSARRKVEAALTEYAELLKHSNRSLEEFAFIASHDLQEPLRKITAFGELLSTRYHDQVDARGQEYVERMQDAARRMQAMIDGLLAYSRVGTRERAFERVSLFQATREALTDLEMRLRTSRGRVDLGELPVIEADPLQMRQLLLNLIGNALKFTKPGVPPEVRVSAVLDDDDWLELSVADNGVGIPAQHTGELFQPFGRLHGRSQYEGAGIGLAICHKIVERHGGSIRVESVPGEGATFIVRLPCKQEK